VRRAEARAQGALLEVVAAGLPCTSTSEGRARAIETAVSGEERERGGAGGVDGALWESKAPSLERERDGLRCV
jgi:hypothetical protein